MTLEVLVGLVVIAACLVVIAVGIRAEIQRRRTVGTVVVTIDVDLTAFTEGMRRAGEAMQAMRPAAERAGQAMRAFGEAMRKELDQ